MTELALSISSLAKQDHSLLSQPITTLAKKAGLRANDVYVRLLPALGNKSLKEALSFAELGLKYAAMIDQNRLREEIGQEFIIALDMIIALVQEGLDSDENYLKRKAMVLHGILIDEHSEKRRFVETILIENKLEELATAKRAQEKLAEEIIDI